MRFRHSGPIDWPSQAQWDERSRADLDAEHLPPIDGDGRVVLDDDAPTDLRIVLVAGEHGRVGARYEVHEPSLTRGAVSCRLVGSSAHPAVELSYREPSGAEASVRADGIGRMRSLHAASDLPHLDLEVHASATPPAVLRARLRLDWLRADLHVDVRRGRARVRGRIRGAGVWRLLLAPLWLVLRLRGDVGTALYQQVLQIAADDGDAPTGDVVDPPTYQEQVTQARIRRWSRLRILLDEAIATVQARPRWRRDSAAWVESTRAMHVALQVWRDVEAPGHIHVQIERDAIEAIVEEVGAAPQIERRVRAHTLVAERIEDERRSPRTALGRPIGRTAVDVDAWADLRWLRSPVTAIRHVAAQSRGPDAPPLSLWRPSTWGLA